MSNVNTQQVLCEIHKCTIVAYSHGEGFKKRGLIHHADTKVAGESIWSRGYDKNTINAFNNIFKRWCNKHYMYFIILYNFLFYTENNVINIINIFQIKFS